MLMKFFFFFCCINMMNEWVLIVFIRIGSIDLVLDDYDYDFIFFEKGIKLVKDQKICIVGYC